jgi:hypothetical protein
MSHQNRVAKSYSTNGAKPQVQTPASKTLVPPLHKMELVILKALAASRPYGIKEAILADTLLLTGLGRQSPKVMDFLLKGMLSVGLIYQTKGRWYLGSSSPVAIAATSQIETESRSNGSEVHPSMDYPKLPLGISTHRLACLALGLSLIDRAELARRFRADAQELERNVSMEFGALKCGHSPWLEQHLPKHLVAAWASVEQERAAKN